MHDCEGCEVSGKCPVECVHDWLNDHEVEVYTAKHEVEDNAVLAVKLMLERYPQSMVCVEALSKLAGIMFEVGYAKGRQYQDVPKCFKEG